MGGDFRPDRAAGFLRHRHVEQGPVLENDGVNIRSVENLQSISDDRGDGEPCQDRARDQGMRRR